MSSILADQAITAEVVSGVDVILGGGKNRLPAEGTVGFFGEEPAPTAQP